MVGKDRNHVFPVKIASTESVGTLKELIRDKKKYAFERVDADDLKLWKVSIPVDDDFRENVNKAGLGDEATLSPVDGLTDVFSGPPTPKFLHIIVRSPPLTSE